MADREGSIEKYARELRETCDVDPDTGLLERVAKAAEGDGETLDVSSTDDLNGVKDGFLVGRLGLADDQHLMGGIQKAIRTYGRDEGPHLRPVLYYLLVQHFDKEDALD